MSKSLILELMLTSQDQLIADNMPLTAPHNLGVYYVPRNTQMIRTKLWFVALVLGQSNDSHSDSHDDVMK